MQSGGRVSTPASRARAARTLAVCNTAVSLTRLAADIYSGQSDSTVHVQVVKDLVDTLPLLGANKSRILFDTHLDAGHGVPTLSYGVKCQVTETPFLNNCNFDGAGVALQHLFGGTLSPRVPNAGPRAQLHTLDVSKFLPTGVLSADEISLNRTAYVYVPADCAAGANKCALHVALHGCKQYSGAIGEVFVRHSGLIEWAASNRLVVLFPQTIALDGFVNPQGCFDWWGYAGEDYALRSGNQMQVVRNMARFLGAMQ